MKKTIGVAAAGDRLTAEAGAEILRAGGNAFDAVIASVFMSFAASSSITSAGGGGFLLTHDQKSKHVMYDFFTQTPRAVLPEPDRDFYPVYVDFGDKKQEFHIGLASAAAPGNIAGLFTVHKELGSIPMTEIMAPVLDRMKAGITLHKQTKYQIDILKPILTQSLEGKRIYLNDGRDLQIGDQYYLPKMLDTFEYLAINGPREFYEGEIAAGISGMCAENGGELTYDDLKYYRVAKRRPLEFSYRDAKIFTNPPPSSGGTLIAFLLQLIKTVSLKKGDFGKAIHLQALTDAMKLTDSVRKIKLQTGAVWELEDLLSDKEFLKTMSQTLQKEVHKSGNTTHVSVADRHGNFASCTTSVGEGCGHFIPGTDIMLNNMLGEEDINKQGFDRRILNQRMSSMMSPTIVTKSSGEICAMGSGGSNRIRSAVAQAIINYVDFEMPFDEIVNKPRIHLENDHLDIEPGFEYEETDKVKLSDGTEKFYWKDQNMYFGGVHAAFSDSKGGLSGAGDHRRVGHVETVFK
jgi:gamma-glutamyltranspeptidase / glutathione hydrolase